MRLSLVLWGFSLLNGAFAGAQRYVISTFAGGGPLPVETSGANLSIDWNSKGLAVDAAGNVYFTSLNCVFKLGPDGIVTRIAGNGRPGYSGDGGPATLAQFSMGQLVESPPYIGSLPPGLAVDLAGNVYVADNGNSRIRRISPDGIVTTVAGNGTSGFSGDDGPATRAQLSSVLGLVVDGSGDLLLSDSENHRVRMIAPDGTISTVAGNGVCGFSGDGGAAAIAQLCNPAGMAMDRAGNLFIAEAGDGRIRRISADRIVSTAEFGLPAPTNVAVDVSGNLFVVAADANYWEEWQAVWKLVPGGKPVLVAGGACAPQTANCPPLPTDGKNAITTYFGDRLSTAVDAFGDLLIAAPVNRRIHRVFPDGSITTAAGSGYYDLSGDGGPAASARLADPTSVALDGNGGLFIGDRFNDVIRKVSSGGTMGTTAGNGTWGSSGDGGPAISASLTLGTVIAVDGTGTLFIANQNGGARKVSPDGIINNVTGAGGPLAALVADRAGNLFIAAPDGIRKVFTDGSMSTLVSRAHASALAVDIGGSLYFAEMGRISRLAPDGSTVAVAGNGTLGFAGDGGPATDAQVGYVFGLATDGAGDLFIADKDNSRIRKISTDGIITTIAGNGVNDYSGDGRLATEASISRPMGIVVDGGGNVYFADPANNVIRVLRPANRKAGRL